MQRLRVVCLGFALVLASPPAARAVLIPDSLEDLLASGYETRGLLVTSTPAGDVLVVTSQLAIDPEGQVFTAFFGTIRDVDGVELGGFMLDPRSAAEQQAIAASTKVTTATERFAAAGSANGHFLVVWDAASPSGTGRELVARFFDRHGVPAGPVRVLAETTATAALGPPAVACNVVTRCVVAWTTAPSSGGQVEVEGRVLDSISNPDQETFRFEISTLLGAAPALSVAVASHGHFAVLVTETVPTARLFAGTGAQLGAAIPLLPPEGPPPVGVDRGTAVGAFDEAGALTAVFSAYRRPDLILLWSRRFGPTGQALGGPVQLTETGTAHLPSVASNPESGNLVVAWHGVVDDELGDRVMARALDGEGRPKGSEQVVFDSSSNLYQFGRIDLAFLSPERVGVFWASTFFGPLAPTHLYARYYRVGAASCTGAEAGPRRPCVELGPGGRFQVTAAFRGDDRRSRSADLEALTANAAFLFFRGEENPEVVTKILDGRPINGSFWYFSGAMSNQEYQVTAFDTETDRVAAYYNPPSLLRSLADTSTFVDTPLAEAGAAGAEPVDGELLSLGLSERWAPETRDSFLAPPAGKAAGGVGCLIPTPTSLCLNQARFRVEVRWTDFAGNTGQASAVQTTADGGYFWFFNPNNVELALKILDGRPVNGKFWVFYASLSNVRFVVRIYDESGNLVKVYRNPPRTLASVADTQAF